MTHATIRLLVPVPGSAISRQLREGSAIIGTMTGNALYKDLVTIDYEGNVYDCPSLRRYEDRVHVALGRHVEQYPTTARCAVQASSLLEVGHFVQASDGIQDAVITNASALRGWLGPEELEANLWLVCPDKFQQRQAIAAQLNSLRQTSSSGHRLATMARDLLYAK